MIYEMGDYVVFKNGKCGCVAERYGNGEFYEIEIFNEKGYPGDIDGFPADAIDRLLTMEEYNEKYPNK